MLFDTHCHLTADAFDDDREAVLERAREAGVERIVTIASTPDDAEAGIELAARHEGLWTTAGIHPHEAGAADPGALDRVRTLLERPEVVAVGECGLDFHYDHAPREAQMRAFRAQIEMAAETGLPLVVHSRSADREMMDLLRELPDGVVAVLHCFTGGDELLEVALEAGCWVSFTGIVTFGRYDAGHQVRRVPRDRLMVETDSPYLAPVPHRGERNEPARVGRVAEAVARFRDELPGEVAEYTTRNGLRFYGIG